MADPGRELQTTVGELLEAVGFSSEEEKNRVILNFRKEKVRF